MKPPLVLGGDFEGTGHAVAGANVRVSRDTALQGGGYGVSVAPDVYRLAQGCVDASAHVADTDIESMFVRKVLCADGSGHAAFGVNEDVVDDLVYGSQCRDELARVLELMQDEVTNRIDGPEDVCVSRNQAQWKEPSDFALAATGVVCDPEVLVQIHPRKISERILVAAEQDPAAC